MRRGSPRRALALALAVVLVAAVPGCGRSDDGAARHSRVTTTRAALAAQSNARNAGKRPQNARRRVRPARTRGNNPTRASRAGRARRIRRGPNRGLLQVRLPDGHVLLTHGPDPRPKTPASHGAGIGPGDPERPLVCASDHYLHVLYGRPAGAPNRYAAVKAAIQASMRRSDAVLNE